MLRTVEHPWEPGAFTAWSSTQGGEMVKVRWNGPEIYRGADAVRSASLTLDPGTEIEVSEECAEELLELPGFESTEEELEDEEAGESSTTTRPRKKK
jgi:hypothetical protein